MVTYSLAFLIALGVGASVTLLVRDSAVRRQWLDQTRETRKIHLRPVPRLGGVGIVVGFVAPLVGLLLVSSDVGAIFRSDIRVPTAVILGGFAIALLGLYDDLRGTGAKLKFTVQIAVAVAVYAAGFQVRVVASPFGPPIPLGPLAAPFTILWIVGVVNALNLIDGLDGLAGGVALFAVATNLVLALARGDTLMALMMAALSGAILGFLVFNFNPASIFMGDTGSMFLGFIIAISSLRTSSKRDAVVAMLVPIVALGLPILDTLLAMARRSLLGRPLFSADKDHIHHRLMRSRALSHRATVFVLYGVSALFTGGALALWFSHGQVRMAFLTLLALVVAWLLRDLGYLDWNRLQDAMRSRRRTAALNERVRAALKELRTCGDLESVGTALATLRPTFGWAVCELVHEGAEAAIDLRDGAGQRDAARFSWVGPWSEEARGKGELRVFWTDREGELERGEELALERLARGLGRCVMALVPEGRDGSERSRTRMAVPPIPGERTVG